MPPPHRQSDMLSFSYADIEPHSSLLIKPKTCSFTRLFKQEEAYPLLIPPME